MTGETAILDMKSNVMTMAGGSGVLLSQGKNVLRADRLTVDLTTSVSRLECDAGKRCVTGLFSTDKQGGAGSPIMSPLGNAPSGNAPSGNAAKPAPRSESRGSEPMQISPR